MSEPSQILTVFWTPSWLQDTILSNYDLYLSSWSSVGPHFTCLLRPTTSAERHWQLSLRKFSREEDGRVTCKRFLLFITETHLQPKRIYNSIKRKSLFLNRRVTESPSKIWDRCQRARVIDPIGLYLYVDVHFQKLWWFSRIHDIRASPGEHSLRRSPSPDRDDNNEWRTWLLKWQSKGRWKREWTSPMPMDWRNDCHLFPRWWILEKQTFAQETIHPV